MASIANLKLVNETGLGANKTGEKQSLGQNSSSFIGMLKLSDNSGATVGGVIEHSPDGINWETLCTFSALSANGIDTQQISDSVYPNVRADLTVAGGSGDVLCVLWFDPNKH